MALYLGSNKFKIHLNGVTYRLNIVPFIGGINLSSSDGYILQDINGLYLIPQYFGTLDIDDNILATTDNYILMDTNRLYLTTKEDI